VLNNTGVLISAFYSPEVEHALFPLMVHSVLHCDLLLSIHIVPVYLSRYVRLCSS